MLKGQDDIAQIIIITFGLRASHCQKPCGITDCGNGLRVVPHRFQPVGQDETCTQLFFQIHVIVTDVTQYRVTAHVQQGANMAKSRGPISLSPSRS